MRSLLAFITILSLSVTLNAQVLWQIKKDSVQKWYYQDGDEFDTRFLNTDKWRSGMPWGAMVMTQDLCYTPENISQQNGLLILESKPDKKRRPVADYEIDKAYLEKWGRKVENGLYEVDYSAGMISSLKRYKYGYFELRFKSVAQRGIWPAFWLFGGEPNEEIDFFELKGERDKQLHLDVHCPDGCENYRGGFLNLRRNWGGWVDVSDNLHEGWNIVSGEWQPGYVKWFLNGQPLAYFKGDFKTAQNLLINTSVAKTGAAFSPGPDASTQWPNRFEVDYVRIWSREDTVSTAKKSYREFENSPNTVENNDLYTTELKRKFRYLYNEKALSPELGTICLMQVGSSKYSMSLLGKDLGPVTATLYNSAREKQLSVQLENTEYYVLTIPELPSDLYILEIAVKGKVLRHEIPMLQPVIAPGQR